MHFDECTPSTVETAAGADFAAFIKRALAEKRLAARHVIGPITERAARDVARLIGIDMRGALHQVDASDLRHMLKSHGNPPAERSRGQVPLTPGDPTWIPVILKSYDDVVPGQSKHGRPAVIYRKRVNGTIYYLEEVLAPSKRGGGVARLRGKIMWKRPIRAGDAAGATSPLDVRNAPGTTPST